MAQNNETTTKFKVDISELKKGIQDAQRQIRLANSEFKAAASGMKNWETSSDGLTAKLNQLKTTLTAQKSILSSLEAQYKQVCEEQGENSTAAQNLAIRINNQQAAINKTEASMNQYESELVDVSKAEAEAAKNGTTVEEELEKVANSADDASQGFTVFKGVVANLAASAITAAVSGLKELGAQMLDLGKQAVANYSAYEQLSGGVETLFGAGGKSVEDYAKSVGKSVEEVESKYNDLLKAQKDVIKNANDAYKTAGMDANTYLDTVTSFSASLIESLDGDTNAAAKAANQAIIDMSDNANKMGTNIDDVMNAYKGLSKGQFQLLDNLKLGFAGSKTGMQELLDKAQEISGVEYNIDNLNDLYEAIHVVQTEMGITGTTYEESSKTIEGSLNSMKAAWQNLLTGFAAGDEMDINQLISNFVDSVGIAGKNLIPRIETVITTASTAIPKLINQLFPLILNVINSNLPTLINGGAEIVLSLVNGALSAAPKLISAAGQIVVNLLKMLQSAIPQLVNTVISAIPTIINSLMQAAPQIIQAVFSFGTAILQALPTIVQNIIDILPGLVVSLIDGLMSSFDMLLSGALEFLDALVQAVPLIIKKLVKALPSIVSSIVTNLVKALPQVLNAAIKLLTAIIQAVPLIIKALIPELPNIIITIVKVLVENAPLILEAAVTLLMGLIKAIPEIVKAMNGGQGISQVIDSITTGIKNGISKVKEKASDLAKGFIDALKNGLKTVTTIGEDIIKGLWNGINNMAAWIKSKIEGFGEGVLKALKDFFKIGSPSKLMRDQVGRYIAEGIAEGITENEDSVNKALADLTESASSPIDIGLNSGKARVNSRVVGSGSSGQANTNSYTFNQYNTSPKALSRLEIYRQTRNLINYSKAV